MNLFIRNVSEDGWVLLSSLLFHSKGINLRVHFGFFARESRPIPMDVIGTNETAAYDVLNIKYHNTTPILIVDYEKVNETTEKLDLNIKEG